MVVLSSFYVHIYRAFLILVIVLNTIGILVIKFLLPKEKAITYDLSFNIVLIIFCFIVLILSLKFASVSYDKKNKILNAKTLKSKFSIPSSDVINIERKSIILCKITYSNGDSKKSLIFQPSARMFFPFTDYPERIRKLLGEK
ncbi:hypothetical protein [Epilithonimonas hungarica]|uniref:Uncharacterized protein n=1 Tax=Epilithonimonas hungarica TaxID=454006 RepID=A0A1G7SWA0_9FLAO|nr:hypothetical protein [Epilithonimonas hungarica]SDG27366.1 hypothetical protein SAMN05421825_3104 [Epilithonimonas hungarica]